MSEFYPDIWRLQTQADIRGLIEAVKHTNPDVRRRAVAALRTLGASSAIPALQVALVKEQDGDVRRAMIATLDFLFQQEVDEDSDSSEDQYTQVVRLIAQLSSRQPDRIIRAAQRLGELKEKIAAESLILVFHNAELPARVRLAAAEALLKLESAPIEVALLGAMRHADWRVRRNAIAVLGQLNADWAVGPLSDALKDDSDLIRRTAQAALKRIGTPEALIALAAASLAERQAAEAPIIHTPPVAKVDEIAKPSPDTKAETTDETRPARLPIPVVAKPETAVKTPPTPPPVETKVEAEAEPAPSTPAMPADPKAETVEEKTAAPEPSLQDEKATAAVDLPLAPSPAEPKAEATAKPVPPVVPPVPDTPQTSAVPVPIVPSDEEDTQPTLPVG